MHFQDNLLLAMAGEHPFEIIHDLKNPLQGGPWSAGNRGLRFLK
jgi:hypothetical protein